MWRVPLFWGHATFLFAQSFIIMQTTIHISLNVPPAYQVDELTQQLTSYGERLIILQAAKKQHRDNNLCKRSSRFFLQGLDMPKNVMPEALIDEYLEEKYF